MIQSWIAAAAAEARCWPCSYSAWCCWGRRRTPRGWPWAGKFPAEFRFFVVIKFVASAVLQYTKLKLCLLWKRLPEISKANDEFDWWWKRLVMKLELKWPWWNRPLWPWWTWPLLWLFWCKLMREEGFSQHKVDFSKNISWSKFSHVYFAPAK